MKLISIWTYIVQEVLGIWGLCLFLFFVKLGSFGGNYNLHFTLCSIDLLPDIRRNMQTVLDAMLYVIFLIVSLQIWTSGNPKLLKYNRLRLKATRLHL